MHKRAFNIVINVSCLADVMQGWLLLLQCYSRLMYRPSSDFEGALERYCLGVLPGLGPAALASLVGSAARLQLPLSPQLEDGIITRLEQVRGDSCYDTSIV
jgi:hypothetical protein